MSHARWEDARRLESWAGEMRVNLLRTLALIVFYVYHLINVYAIGDKSIPPTSPYHFQISGLFFLWAVVCMAVYHTLIRRYVPGWLAYTVVGLDLLLVTALCVLNPEGPRSALMLLFFVVVTTAPLRLCLRLVWCTTLGALAGAGFVLGHWVFLRHGTATYYATPALQVPHSSEVIFALCLLMTGLFAGQMVRGTRRLLQGYPVEVHEMAEEIQS